MDDIARAAARSGGQVLRRYRTQVPRSLAIFPDGWGAAKFLAELSRGDDRKADVKAAADALRKGTPNDDAFAAKVQKAVQRQIDFRREIGEIFQSPTVTASYGFGDCDDHARLVVALLRAGGVRGSLGFLHDGEGPRHVSAIAHTPTGAHWVETTIPARYGEDPLGAALRLGIARQDIGTKRGVKVMPIRDDDERVPGAMVGMNARAPRAMGALGDATSDIPDSFFEAFANSPDGAWKMQVAMSESGLSTTAGHYAKGLIQWEPESYPGDGWDAQTAAALSWWNSWQKGVPYTRLGDYYAAVFLPGRRVAPLDSAGTLTRAGESFYDNNRLLDPNHTGVINADTLEAFANRSSVVNSARWQDALARFQAAGGSTPSGGGSGGVSKLATVAVLAIGLLPLGHILAPRLFDPVWSLLPRAVRNVFA